MAGRCSGNRACRLWTSCSPHTPALEGAAKPFAEAGQGCRGPSRAPNGPLASCQGVGKTTAGALVWGERDRRVPQHRSAPHFFQQHETTNVLPRTWVKVLEKQEEISRTLSTIGSAKNKQTCLANRFPWLAHLRFLVSPSRCLGQNHPCPLAGTRLCGQAKIVCQECAGGEYEALGPSYESAQFCCFRSKKGERKAGVNDSLGTQDQGDKSSTGLRCDNFLRNKNIPLILKQKENHQSQRGRWVFQNPITRGASPIGTIRVAELPAGPKADLPQKPEAGLTGNQYGEDLKRVNIEDPHENCEEVAG